jgi:hypothetical protein
MLEIPSNVNLIECKSFVKLQAIQIGSMQVRLKNLDRILKICSEILFVNGLLFIVP